MPARSISRLVVNRRTKVFRREFFPNATIAEWNDWRWQLQNSFRTCGQVERVLNLSQSERDGLRRAEHLPVQITPYYASLLSRDDARQPLRRTVIAAAEESHTTPGEAVEPLNENDDSPVSGIVHRYPDRVLFLATILCPVYCRYCTRSRIVGNPAEHNIRTDHWTAAIDYIARHPKIRDVLISGGDPLLLSDERLEWLLDRLRAIPHLELLRIGTKVPAVLPQRITPSLVRMLRKFHPLWLSLHFVHPDEITREAAEACARLADVGIPLGSQTVLLSGINDNCETMTNLMHLLVKNRVRPYYLYQCDPVVGTGHFRVPVTDGLRILEGMRGFTSGYAVPTYVIDAPGGGGKVPIQTDYFVSRNSEHIELRSYDGRTYRYPDRGQNASADLKGGSA